MNTQIDYGLMTCLEREMTYLSKEDVCAGEQRAARVEVTEAHNAMTALPRQRRHDLPFNGTTSAHQQTGERQGTDHEHETCKRKRTAHPRVRMSEGLFRDACICLWYDVRKGISQLPR